MTNRKQRGRGARRGAGRRGDDRAARASAGRGAGAGRLWLYGLHAVTAALANPARRCHRLVATSSAYDALRKRIGDGLAESGVGVSTMARRDVARVLPEGAVHQGVALEVSPLPDPALDTVCDPARAPRLVLLDRINDPQNLGAVLRAAAAFGAGAVIVPERHAPGESGALAKAASGALEAVPLIRVANLASAIERLKRSGYWCIGLDAGAPEALARARPDGAAALVLGAEGAGLRRLTRERCDSLARLPISNAVESLNVAAAAAVALYELTREL